MDFKIWQETILSWIISLDLSKDVNRFDQVNGNVIQEILRIIQADSGNNIIDFVNKTFPNYIIEDASMRTFSNKDYLLISTLILIYVCFENNRDLDDVKEKMCVKLNNSVQEDITKFLFNIQKQGDVFSITEKIVTEEIQKFMPRQINQYSASGDGVGTPVNSLNKAMHSDSPLQEFLQTPKRRCDSKYRNNSGFYSNSDQLKKIKELTDQLVEEELEKASLQEKLTWHEVKCNDYEVKLKNKIEELEQIKNEWQKEITENENQIKHLNKIIEDNLEEKEKYCKELSHFENYVSTLEKDLSNIKSEKKTLECKLKNALNKVDDYNEEVQRLSKINNELEETMKAHEVDLERMNENEGRSRIANDSLTDPSLNEMLDSSITKPENMGVVIEMLLKERTSENETLKEAIDAMKLDKECLSNELNLLKSQLSAKVAQNSQLQKLNEELVSKIDGFTRICNDFQKVQKSLVKMSRELYEIDGCVFNLSGKPDFSSFFDSVNGESLLDSEPIVNLFKESEAKELQVIYDSNKEPSQLPTQLSLENNKSSHLTPIMENLNESETSSLTSIHESDANSCSVEKLNKEIITAKKSLIEFLKASMRNFEVLKLKENLINEMSKQHEHLQNRITSLTELNTRLTKDVVNSKTISTAETELKEKEVGSLKLEVESLKKAMNVLKEKLADLEKTNEDLVNEKEECFSELSFLRERNKSLANDMQNKVMTQMKQQNFCLGFMKNKQETALELEKTLKDKDVIKERFTELRSLIPDMENQLEFENLLNSAEQRFYVICHNLLSITYSCFKWSDKNVKHQYFLVGQGDTLSGEDFSENSLQKEQEENREKLRNVSDLLKSVSQDLDDIKSNCKETCFSDSIEIISDNNKTFSIIGIDDNNINEETFSIKSHEVKDKVTSKENNTAWVISPPSKTVENKINKKDNVCQGKSWVIALTPPGKQSQTCFLNNGKSGLSRLKFYSSDVEGIDSKTDMKKSSSFISFASAADSVASSGTYEKKSKDKISGSDSKNRLKRSIRELEKELTEVKAENELLRSQLKELEERRLQDKENFDKSKKIIKENITAEYENQLGRLKSEMKSLYNKELAKHKAEQSKMTSDLEQQNKIFKDRVDDLRNQLWELGEKVLKEQNIKRDLERNLEEFKKYNRMFCLTEIESRSSQESDFVNKKEKLLGENYQTSKLRRFGSSSFPTIPTEDEDEVFDNRCLEDMKAGICKVEGPEGRLTELQYRNSLCPPHLKSSYPLETQFHNPKLYRENELKYGVLNFGQESQSLTDSDHSMTRSLLPQENVKKKEQTSYKKPGPPTPSKNGGRLSGIQSMDIHVTPRVLREGNGNVSDRKSTPGRIKCLFTTKSAKRENAEPKDENTAPVLSRGKKLRIFSSVKPFGGRDY